MIRSAVTALALPSALLAQVSLTQIAAIDVSTTANPAAAEYIGTRPAAIAWDGVSVWLAGRNDSAAAGDTAIVRIDNPLTAATFGNAFGTAPATPSGFGFTGLARSGGRLAAAHDSGASAVNGIAHYDLAGNLAWLFPGRGSSGIAFDPGYFTIAGIGTAWTSIGASRRALQVNASGLILYSLTNGMVLDAGQGRFWRDVTFDPATGDAYLRKSNEVILCERVGPNSATNRRVLVMTVRADLVDQQHIVFAAHPTRDLIFWNERRSTQPGQPFAAAIRCHTPTGNELTVLFDYGNLAPPGAGDGAYDIDYDATTATLAICDGANRMVHVFAVSSWNNYGTGCPGRGNFTPRLLARGDTRGGGSIQFDVSNAAPSSVGALVFGVARANIPIPFPGSCPQHVAPLIFQLGPFFTSPGTAGSGTARITLGLNPGLRGLRMTTQAVIAENGSLNALVTTNGIETVLQ
ncbi:MAG: hypothetical protein NXI31_12085 [bacterium]|nr:hypothetical protein [bacterium]